MKMPHSFFSNFTNLYPIQKTLRRELKALNHNFEQDPSLTALFDAQIPARDEQRAEDYQAIKPLLDQLHEKFIVQSLEKVKGENWSDFVTFFLAYQQHKKQKADLSEKELRSLEEEFTSRTAELRKAIANAYSTTANERILSPDYQDAKGNPLLKQKGYKILTEQGILSVLEKMYAQDEEKVALIKRFGSFFTYFSGFNQNRENYYSMEEKSTAVAYRVVNQNLLTFANNTQLKEKLSVLELSEQEKAVFDPENYGNYLSQAGIDEYNRQLASIRSKSNLYQQQQKIKLPQPKDLYKQIGAEQESKIPFDLIETDQELQKTLQLVLTETDQRVKKIAAFFAMLKEENLDLSQIFLSKSAFNQLSNRYFANWHLLLEKGVEHKLFAYKKNDEEKFKLPAYISLAQLKLLLESLPTTKAEGEESIGLFKQHLEKKQKGGQTYWDFLVQEINADMQSYLFASEQPLTESDFLSYTQAKEQFLNLNFDKTNQDHKNLLKALLDAPLGALRMVKRFRVDSDKLGFVPEGERYDRYDEIVEDYVLPKWYDMIRNYLTKKPYSEAKLKLNFDYSSFFQSNSWGHYALIFKENERYYLGIVKNDFQARKLMKDIPTKKDSGLGCMKYRQIKFQTLAGKGYIRDYGVKYSEDQNAIVHLQQIIQNQYLKKYPELKPIVDAKCSTKKDFDKLVKDTLKETYSLEFECIDRAFIGQQIKENNLFLFQISSKDFNGKSATPDLQTLYRKQIFEAKSNVKLNGNAKIFFRPGSIKKEKKKLKTDNFDVFKNNRYTEDKLLFHVPITLGFGNNEISPTAPSKFNQKINQELIIPHFDDLHVIGVDRGEKHLAFYSVVSVKTGKVVEQGTLNIINGVDYEAKLSEKAKDRLEARKNRDTIEKIADLKEGYISQVVKKLTDLMIRYRAVLVFEDLNGGFKRGRQRIEQSVYQKLELALAKKLAFLVDKKVEIGQPGSVDQGLQLAPQVNTFGDIKGKQRGMIFYTRANYTSITDPLTGWRKSIYLKKGSAQEMKNQILTTFQKISRDAVQKAYIFDDGKRKLFSNVERRRGKRDDHWNRKQTKYDPTFELDNLFAKYQIEKSDSILDHLKNRDLPQTFWTSLVWILDLMMQIRNTDDEGRDVIISSIGNAEERFDSRKWFDQYPSEESNTASYPTSGDANGAYNIARKGIMMLERIKGNSEKPDLLIRDSEWDEWLRDF